MIETRLNKTAKTSKSKEPLRIGKTVKRAEAFDNSPSGAIAPAGGCKQSYIFQRGVAEATT